MVLTIDIGNTNITLGGYAEDKIQFISRLATDARRTADQYAVEIYDLVRLSGYSVSNVEGCIISSVVLFAILSGSMHGVNTMLICMIPQFFEKSGKVSTVSGVINSCTYIGSAISTYGIALLSEQKGWSFTLGSWIAIAVLGTLICAFCIKAFGKKFKD